MKPPALPWSHPWLAAVSSSCQLGLQSRGMCVRGAQCGRRMERRGLASGSNGVRFFRFWCLFIHTRGFVSSSSSWKSFVGVVFVIAKKMLVGEIVRKKKSSNQGIRWVLWCRQKTGCRRRIVIKEDLVAEEPKTSRGVTHKSFPLKGPFKLLGEQQLDKQQQ